MVKSSVEDPVLFSSDPDPTRINEYIIYFLSWVKYLSQNKTNQALPKYFNVHLKE